MHRPPASSRLTSQAIKVLQELGYQYMVIKGYTPDRRNDHIELNHFMLEPVKQLSEEPGQTGIFAPIDSDIIRDWANQADDGVIAFIEGYPSSFQK
jgi:hypothetical protein